MSNQSNIREEELKNRVATLYFGKYDCDRIVGNIDFCVLQRRRDPRQMTFVPDAPIFWAEAKNHPTDIYRMLAQLILTIKDEQKNDVEPPRFVGCFDNEKIAFVEYHYILPVFNLNDFNWTQTPSAVDDKTVETVRGVIPQDKIVVFNFGADDAEIKSFIARNFTSGDSPALATPIDRNNFTFIYQKWRTSVMQYIDAPWDVLKKKYALYDRDFFLAEMNVDDKNTPEVSDDRPAEDFYITFDASAREPYTIRRKNEDELNFNLTFGFKPCGLEAYSAFWRRYKRPPKREYWDFIVSRLDLLVPQDVRERKGSFFTPAIWVEKSQQYIAAVLGENWQDEYYVWDCAGGTGNLEVGLTNKYRVWVSTLDQQDVDVMLERARNGANLLESHVFQFDFLNDSFDKLPNGLKEIIDDPEKRRRLVIYINPPYAEGDNRKGEGRSGVAAGTMVAEKYGAQMGYGKRELFIQFLMRIHEEIPGCIIGQFSKLKHLQGTKFGEFRESFNATLEKCFVVPADTFDNVKGEFPIGFFVWRLGDDVSRGGAETQRGSSDHLRNSASPRENKVFTSALADVYDSKGAALGQKTLFSYDGLKVINDWIVQFASNDYSDRSMGTIIAVANDFQNRGTINLCEPNKKWNHKFQWQVLPENLIPSAIYFAARLCIDADWLNDRDQFLYPNDGWKDDAAFQADCLVYALFSGQNRVKSADGVNHWIPFTEEEVGAKDCFASHFMSDFINGRGERPRSPADARDARPYQSDLFAETPHSNPGNPVNPVKNNSADSVPPRLCVRESLSPAARAVLDAGRELWRYYHAQPAANPNASYYDIRAYFQGCKPNGAMNAKSDDATYNALLATLRAAHKKLAAQIEPKVYAYGFLKR